MFSRDSGNHILVANEMFIFKWLFLGLSLALLDSYSEDWQESEGGMCPRVGLKPWARARRSQPYGIRLPAHPTELNHTQVYVYLQCFSVSPLHTFPAATLQLSQSLLYHQKTHN